MNCKFCEKSFHSCSSCGHIYSWEYSYCSSQCAANGLEEVVSDLEVEIERLKEKKCPHDMAEEFSKSLGTEG